MKNGTTQPVVTTPQEAMSEVITLAEQSIHPGRQGVELAGMEARINELLQNMYQSRDLPAVCHLGFTDYYQPRRTWALVRPIDGVLCNLPAGKERPRDVIQTSTGRYAVRRADAVTGRGPFRLMRTNEKGEDIGGLLLPPMLPTGLYTIANPFPAYPGGPECSRLDIGRYPNGGPGISLFAFDGEPMAKLSVNLHNNDLPVRPGHFWVKTWIGNESVFQAAVNTGLLCLTGHWTPVEAGDCVALEGCLDYRKLRPFDPAGETSDEPDAAEGPE